MKTLNYVLEGLGFQDWVDFKISSFGFVIAKIVNISAIIAIVAPLIEKIFGFSYMAMLAYVILIIFEWVTGVIASNKRNEKHESRKLGRMLLKIFVYTLLIYIPNTFQKELVFPSVFGYEIDPFLWLYWMVLLVIVWQLIVSVLENLDQLGFKFASVLLKIINKKFYKQLDIEE